MTDCSYLYLSGYQNASAVDSVPGTYEEIYEISNRNRGRNKEKKRQRDEDEEEAEGSTAGERDKGGGRGGRVKDGKIDRFRIGEEE